MSLRAPEVNLSFALALHASSSSRTLTLKILDSDHRASPISLEKPGNGTDDSGSEDDDDDDDDDIIPRCYVLDINSDALGIKVSGSV